MRNAIVVQVNYLCMHRMVIVIERPDQCQYTWLETPRDQMGCSLVHCGRRTSSPLVALLQRLQGTGSP